MENKKLTLGSLFDGSGAFPLGGILAGIEPVFSCEIEPFPVLVTHKRLPQVKHYGDVSALNGAELEPVDIITFGSPCQDYAEEVVIPKLAKKSRNRMEFSQKLRNNKNSALGSEVKSAQTASR